MLSRFFIDRPIFAAVISIVIILAGGISYFRLPLAQFPQITPPTVQVTCNYPGASAKEVADAVAAPIEQQVNGVERMMYMSSQSANDGSYNLMVTFQQGVDLNMAQVLVQNRVNLAVPQLPEVIKQTGVTTRKRAPDILMGMAIFSPDGSYNQLYLSNFALMQIKDELSRLPGVGDVFLFGQRDYSMRIWLDPAKLATRGITAGDVVQCIREQNAQVAAGAIGQEPMRNLQETQVSLSARGRLSDEEEFGNIVLKTGAGGRMTRLKDVARVELSAKNQDINTRLDGRDTVFLAIFQMPDANALELKERILKKMEELKRESFPEGVDYDIGFDTTPYTSESLKEVLWTLLEAIILVALVVLLFLQNWRSAIIPLVTVPVAIVGTLAVMLAIGFSLNNLTLFGLVLAIGIVVDDAIVVVEAVEHHIENGLSPRNATIAAMQQVSGPVIAVGLVLSAVFVPCAFISGITGQFFRQFALTIAVSTIISAFNSLTLSPALAALLLRPLDEGKKAGKQAEKHPPLPRLAYPLAGAMIGWLFIGPRLNDWLTPWLPERFPVTLSPGLLVLTAIVMALVCWFVSRPLNRLLAFLFRTFNASFSLATAGYVRIVGGMLRVSFVVLLIYGGLVAFTYERFQSTRRGFIPAQDMGYMMVNVQLPDATSMERTDQVMRKIEKIALNTPGVRHATGIAGQSFVLNAAGSNFGSLFVNLKPYPERRDPSLSSDAIAQRLREQFAVEILDANVAVFGPPPVRGVGRAGGFAVMIEDRGDLGSAALQKQLDNFVDKGNQLGRDDQHPLGMFNMFSVFRAKVPQIYLHADPGAVSLRGVTTKDLTQTLEVYEGSLYVNDFNLFGRTWQVILQAEAAFRSKPEDLYPLRTRNAKGAMVPLGSLGSQRDMNGPLVLTRYNMYPAASVNGTATPGVSSGQVMESLRGLFEQELAPGMAYEWTDMSYLEVIAGNTAMIIFAFAVIMVFLVLAAQYESWSLPLAVILVVPMCLLSAIIGVNQANQDINIFTQIGFVVLVGLASKNAILIVEFAKVQRRDGNSARQATLEACKLRLRPIIMTSLSFILGTLPLIVTIDSSFHIVQAVGAGAEMRRTLGIAVFSGMLGVTLFGIVLTPVFFFTIDWLGGARIFQLPIVRMANTVSLSLLVSMTYPWRMVRRIKEAAPARRVVTSANGQVKKDEKSAIGPHV